ncbi:MAG: endonuclease domain-containing protein, partial [Christensenellaceae bacterium]|nr:endonuclease domain-containing protein [Christensenellaceae bacterium]
MLKFSAGYTKINPNFVIQNLTTDNGPTTTPVLAILNNVLQRGCPTIPSKFLQKAFGKPLYRKDFLYYYNFSDCNWNRVIKGGDISNPALNFYQKILPKVLGQYAKTFIAECPLTYIIEDYEDNETVSEQVDFYSPLFNAVIEIDGVQHITRSEQSIKDSKRNQLLKNHNVDIIRIKTSELNDFRVIKERFSSLKINEDYRKAIFNNNNKICNADINYMTATRIELLLLSLYEYGRLKLEDKELCINVFSAEGIQKNIFEKCIYNFLILLKSICLLQNIDFNIPHIQLILADSELALSEMQGINVCISLKDVYSQINFNNIIYIKNDFFLYEDNLFSEYDQNNGYSKYLYKKNYFHIKTQNVSY